MKNNFLFESIPFKAGFFTLCVIGFAVFFNSLFNDFVWLDKPYLVNNPTAQQLDIVQLFHGNALTSSSYYRPLAAIYLSVVLALSHNQAFLFHILQISLRILNATFLFFIFTYFLKRSTALFLSLVYLVHPLIESSVTYISASADVLSMFFGLSAFLLTIKIGQERVKRYLIFPVLLMSILTKESGILFFGVIFMFIFLFRKSDRIYYSVWLILTSMQYGIMRLNFYGIQTVKNPIVPIVQLSLTERLLSTPKIILYYLQNFVYPFSVGINNMWYVKKITIPDFFLPLLIDVIFFFCTVGLGTYIYKQKHKSFSKYLFFFLFFWIGFSFYFQIIPLDYTVSGKWFAFPMIGLLGMIGIGIQQLYIPKRYALICAFFIIFALSLRTIVKNTYWANDLALFSHGAQVRTNYAIEDNLAGALYTKGDYKQAFIHIQKSIALRPLDATYAHEGLVLKEMGKERDANIAFEKALHTKSYTVIIHDEITYITLIKYLLSIHAYGRAEHLLDDARTTYPRNQTLWILSAYTQYFLHNKDGALHALDQASIVNSGNARRIADLYMAIENNLPLDISTLR